MIGLISVMQVALTVTLLVAIIPALGLFRIQQNAALGPACPPSVPLNPERRRAPSSKGRAQEIVHLRKRFQTRFL